MLVFFGKGRRIRERASCRLRGGALGEDYPAYGAVQSILYAAKRACAGKSSIQRINIKRKMKAGPVPNWILGGTFRFSSKTNDPLNGGFWLYQVQANGSLKQIGRL